MRSNGTLRRITSTALVLAMVSLSSGCQFFKTDKSRWLSPDRVIKAPKEIMPVRAIRMNISPADQAEELVPGSTFPADGDWTYSDEDYILGAGDILDISVLDLFAEGLETILRRQISESGFIDMPLLPDRIRADGVTKEQLQQAIVEAYSPDILRTPTVSVTVLAQRQNTFSILGALDRPGQYNLIRRDMRLLEALAVAGGIMQTNIRYIYVIRQTPPTPESQLTDGRPVAPQPSAAPAPAPGELPPLPEPLDRPAAEEAEPAQPSEPPPPGETQLNPEDLRRLLEGLQSPGLPAPEAEPSLAEMISSEAAPDGVAAADVEELMEGPYRWDYKDGQWVRTAIESEADIEPVDAPAPGPVLPEGVVEIPRVGPPEDPFQWRDAGLSGVSRVIAIDLAKLQGGDPRMNVVIRDKDVVHVPRLEIGEFYIMGEVFRPGAYSLTGRRVTVKMALAAAGNLSGLAWPENSVLIRRVGDSEEQMIPLNIERIVRGEEEDYFLKTDDVIAVGTDIRAPFLAVLRNAFRMTYGFGFIYDRNFANPAFPGLGSNRFTRW